MIDRKIEYKSGATVAQRAPIYLDVNIDPRARSQAYLNLYSSRVGAPVIGVDAINGKVIATSNGDGIGAATGNLAPFESLPGDTMDSPIPKLNAPPVPVSNLVATWDDNDNLILTFTWDPANSGNVFAQRFVVEVKDSVTNKFHILSGGYGYVATSFIDQGSSSQTLKIPMADLNAAVDGIWTITQVGIAAADYVQAGVFIVADVPALVSKLPQPTFTLAKGTDYYTVSVTNLADALAKSNFYGIIVEENITTETVKSNVSLTVGWNQASPIITTSPITIYAPDDSHRWVRLKYVGKSGAPSIYSDILDITPDAFIPVNTNPPTQFTGSTISWSGNDIVIGFTQPASNAGTTIKVKLVPYINGSESSSIYAYYYHSIVGTETSFTIKSLDLYGQFGTYYSKFKSYVTSVSNQGIETTGAIISAGPATRTSTLSSVYPTIGTPNTNSPSGVFRVTAISNGYVVDFDLPAGATYLEVYEKSTAWTDIPIDDTNMVYSGLSPATVITPNNTKRYVIVHFYDQYGNESHYSNETSGQSGGVAVTPIDVGTFSLIANPIKISTDGSIFSGAGTSTDYPQVFFNKDGLFAYDASGNWTTEIINTATTNSPTFITKRAVIGDWTISPNKIENDSYVSGNTYTGLSASGTYAFWAGSETSGGDANSKFSVTPSGIVKMTDVHIMGVPDDGSNTSIAIGGSDETAPFKVTTAGALTASSATITGSITVNQQSYFNANVNISSGSYLISTGTGTVKVGAEGLLALNSSAAATTKIYSSPITVNGTSGISLWSSKALFGANESSGWLIADGTIQSTYITLSSASNYLKIVSKTSNSTKGVRLIAGADNEYAIEAGLLTGTSSATNADFWVKHDGSMGASNATITGTISASVIHGGTLTGLIDSDASHTGYWLDSDGSVAIRTGGNGYVALLAANVSSSSERPYTNAFWGIRAGYGFNGTQITGVPVQGAFDISDAGVGGHFGGFSNMGSFARQRMMVEDINTGQMMLGMAVYYSSSAELSNHGVTGPVSGGYQGDLWVVY